MGSFAPTGQVTPARTIYLVEDDVVSRSALFAMLDDGGQTVIRPFRNAEDFEEEMAYLKGGVVIIDVNLPGIDGISLAQSLSDRRDMAVVMITGGASLWQAVAAMRAGAVDFLEKPISPSQLREAVAQAEKLRCDRMYREDRVSRARLQIATLSPRERSVLAELVEGHSNKEIARNLGVSPRTVEVHRANIMRRSGIDNLAGLIRLALTAELNAPDSHR